jgi:hypothetical protein
MTFGEGFPDGNGRRGVFFGRGPMRADLMRKVGSPCTSYERSG